MFWRRWLKLRIYAAVEEAMNVQAFRIETNPDKDQRHAVTTVDCQCGRRHYFHHDWTPETAKNEAQA